MGSGVLIFVSLDRDELVVVESTRSAAFLHVLDPLVSEDVFESFSDFLND